MPACACRRRRRELRAVAPQRASRAAVTARRQRRVQVRRLRDACILLAGHRCYREFPIDWCRRHLAQTDLEVVKTESFPILYSEASIGRQIDVAARKLPLFEDRALAASMRAHID